MEDASAYLVKLAEDATLGSTETSRGRPWMCIIKLFWSDDLCTWWSSVRVPGPARSGLWII